ncbi:hypothetical protein OJF2_64850 [Aquisphaera giovannonii]|uniref:Uncharacterized protein n=1 Tax=Aquisphaera giovannonii TaxID=406548 RepID=A0A5B9WBP2_9BACT|nr:hypothetical protein [Aquisphaera giovannonii]QEH37893.1 hypothetical protein OJF2_64850 [Aquisphaera giovannonii]
MTRIAWLVAATAALSLSRGLTSDARAQGRAPSQARGATGGAVRPPSPADGGGGEAAKAATDRLPDEFVILNNVGDFDEFLKRLKQPDWIFMRPGAQVVAAAGAAQAPAARDFVVKRVAIRGRVVGELADLRLELDLELMARGEAWVPLGIRSQIVTSARERDQELELRGAGEGRWDVRLRGTGEHRIVVAMERPLRVSPDRTQLEVAIPEAASTYLELDVPQAVRDVGLGPGESIATAPLPDGLGTRLTAHLAPRSSLAVAWTNQDGAGSPLPPLLTAQVEMAMDADAESMTTRSSWVIRCVRGQARRLEIRLDPTDVARQVKLDDQFIAAGIEGNVLTIPLGEPLRPGDTRRLMIETRRGFPPGGGRKFAFNGLPLAGAAEQTGAIALTQAPNLWLDISAAAGLRRIDPRELPTDLRTRPGTSMAFQFLDQPFQLSLSVEDSPPLYRASTATRIVLDGEAARVEMSAEIQRVRGRLFEVLVDIPPGLELTSAGPPDVVESVATAEEPAAGPRGGGPASTAGKLARIHLTAMARDLASIPLKLGGLQRIGADGEVGLALFSPRGDVATSGTVAVLAPRNVTLDVPDAAPGADGSSGFRSLAGEDRAAVVTGAGGGGRVPVAVLASQGNPSRLRGRLVRHRTEISHDVKVAARILEGWVDVRQETAVEVRYGSVRELHVLVPVARRELWQVKGRPSITVGELEPAADGRPARCRLTFDPPIEDATTLTFSMRQPITRAAGPDAPAAGKVSWARIEEGKAAGVAVELSTAPGVMADVDASGWESPEARGDAGTPAIYRLTGAGANDGLPFTPRRAERAALPPLVAPRALLRTSLGPDGSCRTQAWFWIEDHPGHAELALPAGSQWIRARVDGRLAEQVERAAEGDAYRIPFPPESAGHPVLLDLEYQAGVASGRDWAPPELRGGAAVLQSLWEVRVPWNQAVVGVPAGWDDENQWYWDLYAWKRRPRRPFARLLEWLSASRPAEGIADDPMADSQDETHAYLFARPGPPSAMRPRVASRAWLLAVCSGAVLAAGFCAMFARRRPRFLAPALASAALLAMAVVDPSVLLLAAQSSICGVLLVLLGLATRRYIDGVPAAAAAASAPGVGGGSGIAELPASRVGSDDSTAVRNRPSSTMDYASPLSFSAGPDPTTGSRLGQGGR